MLGIGAAAGPSVVGEVSKAISLPGTTSSIYNTAPSMFAYDKDIAVKEFSPVENLKHWKEEYSKLTTDREKWIEEYIQSDMREYLDGYGFQYDRIPADIRAMKSLSEQTKIRLYFERKAMRRYEHNKGHIWDRIQEYMKMV